MKKVLTGIEIKIKYFLPKDSRKDGLKSPQKLFRSLSFMDHDAKLTM